MRERRGWILLAECHCIRLKSTHPETIRRSPIEVTIVTVQFITLPSSPQFWSPPLVAPFSPRQSTPTDGPTFKYTHRSHHDWYLVNCTEPCTRSPNCSERLERVVHRFFSRTYADRRDVMDDQGDTIYLITWDTVNVEVLLVCLQCRPLSRTYPRKIYEVRLEFPHSFHHWNLFCREWRGFRDNSVQHLLGWMHSDGDRV